MNFGKVNPEGGGKNQHQKKERHVNVKEAEPGRVFRP